MIPRRLRMAIRRRHVARLRDKVGDVWPILPGSEQPPPNWPGWPDGKKFAFVLTHDVESQAGLNNCRRLMDLEEEQGFRSSFNFIPEGPYKVPADLRAEMVRRGFEVGVHDLRHDGRLYGSRRRFKEKAKRINHYLGEWNAVGFRSAFMLNRLDWLHELNIEYDSSTFDTDPFEPQPEGRHTIFPFWVPAPSAQRSEIRSQKSDLASTPNSQPCEPPGSDCSFSASQPFSVSKPGYVELPYTLPQDSTLFLLLGETSPGIWLNKIDWIAAHGGMALLNVHPDYLCISSENRGGRTFPDTFYRDLLTYVRENHAHSSWQTLPRSIAGFTRKIVPAPFERVRKRIGMVTHSIYTSDNRVRRYAEALASRGDHVEVFALRRSSNLPRYEVVKGVHIHRVQDRFRKSERTKAGFLYRLLRFFCIVCARLTRRHFQKPYDVLHIHNVPDFLVFAAWYPKLTGARIVLDIHDIIPELFASKFQTG
ncbi:MAG: glycosyltransferase, partial [Acidobacteriota bacterium]|nr:glycosyltransferase [Acidobacteriota bacterium]